MSAVVYNRVSTVEQAGNLSLPTQDAANRHYCAQHGLDVDRVFTERGESAKTADRTELREMLAYVARRRGAIKALVIYRVDRLARNRDDFYALRAVLKTYGCAIHSATERLDESIEGIIMETFAVMRAQVENIDRSRRTLDGMKAACARGRYPWPAPVGYKNVAGTLEPDPDLAPIVRDAFTAAARGATSVADVYRAARQRGLPIARSGFYELLRRPVYAGRIVRPEWGIDVAGIHEPLTDWPTFRRAAAAASGHPLDPLPGTSRRAYTTGSTADFPFRQVAACADCARPLNAYWARGRSKRYPFYRCTSCSRHVRAETMNRSFETLIESLSTPPPIFDLFEAILRELLAAGTIRHREELTTARRQLTETQRRLDVLTSAHIYEGRIDEHTYRREHAKLSTRLHDLEAQTSLQSPDPLRNCEPVLDTARELLQTPLNVWDRLNPASRPTFLRTAFSGGLAYTFNGELRTVGKCLMFLPIAPEKGARVLSGTPRLTDFEPWLADVIAVRGLLAA